MTLYAVDVPVPTRRAAVAVIGSGTRPWPGMTRYDEVLAPRDDAQSGRFSRAERRSGKAQPR